MKRIFTWITAVAMLVSVTTTCFAAGEMGMMPEGMEQGMPGGGMMPDGGMMPPPSGSNAVTETTAVSMAVNGWFFTRYLQEDGSYTSTINSYIGEPENGVVVVPGILGGGVVTEIGQSAFRNSGITTVLIPDSVEKLNSWSFYDCVNLTTLTIANPAAVIESGMCQNSPSEGKSLMIYTDGALDYRPDAANAVRVEGQYSKLTVTMQEGRVSSALNLGAYGCYYIPDSMNGFALSEANGVLRADVKGELSLSGAQGAYLWIVENYDDSELDLSKDIPEELKVASALAEQYGLSAAELDQTFYAYTSEEADERNETTKSGEFANYLSRLTFTEGFYLNGRKVLVDPEVVGYDAASGTVLFDYAGNDAVEKLYVLLPDALGAKSEGVEPYNYVTYRDLDGDGVIDVLFYAWNVLSSDSTMVTLDIESDDPVVNEYLNGVSGRIALDGNYYSFINGAVSADGEAVAMDTLEINSTDGNTQSDVQAGNNEERSLLWATNGGSISVRELQGTSTSEGNWTKIRDEINSYLGQPMEVIMQWGMNAALYATQGGSITVGDPEADIPTGVYTSNIYTCGDGANGIVATATGNEDGSTTSMISVYDTEFVLEGWNNHVADCIYGGYVRLDNVKGMTGKAGSYIMNNGSTLANDFGDGVLNVTDYIGEAWGDSSAGAYMIGNGGRLVIADSTLVSHLNAGIKNVGGVVTAQNVDLIGMSAYAGAGTANFAGGTWTLRRDYVEDGYVYGTAAAEIAQLWYDVTGSTTLLSYVMSGVGNTYADLWEEYGVVIGESMSKEAFYSAVNEIADRYGYGEAYYASDDALLRNSMFDNTYYAIMRNGFQYSPVDGSYSLTALADWSDVPYLYASNLAYLYNALIDCSDAVSISNVTFAYDDSIGDDYKYFSTGTGAVYLNDCENASGLVTDGVIVFDATDFNGSFAAGSKGLWDGTVEYTNALGERTRLNGNYAGVESDGAQAAFRNGSVWTVTHESYLEKLTLTVDAKLVGTVVSYESRETAEDGSVTYVNAVVAPLGAEPSETDVAEYTVAAGDTLWSISQKFYGTGFKWEIIYQANRNTVQNPGLIFVGQKLVIPAV